MASNFVAIEFDKQGFRATASQVQGKNVRIRAAFEVEHSEDDDNRQIGAKLKSALNENGFSRGDAIIVINRSDVEIREITVPPAPDNELPSLVRFKSKTEFATATDNWEIDFIPLSGNETTERDLLASALSGRVSARLSEIVESAGLKAKHIVLRPLATVNLLSGELGQEFCLIVDPNGEQVDLTLVNNQQVILTRSVRSNAHGDLERLFQQLTLEVQRTLASAVKRIGTKGLDKIIICGEKKRYEPLGDTLEEKVGAAATYINPFSQITLKGQTPESPERYASLVGALIAQGLGRKHQIDFLNPRKPVVQRGDHSKKYLIGGLVAAMFAAFGFYGWYSLGQQTKTIEKMNKQLTALRNENAGRGDEKGVEQIIGEVEKVDRWLATAPNWLDELAAISSHSLDSDRVIVDKFTASTGNQQPVVFLEGRMKGHEINTELQMQLTERPYRVFSSGSTDTTTRDYPVTMKQELKIDLDLATTQEEINGRANLAINGVTSTDEQESE